MYIAVSYHIAFKCYSDQLGACSAHTYCGKQDTIVIVTSSHCLLKFFLSEEWNNISLKRFAYLIYILTSMENVGLVFSALSYRIQSSHREKLKPIVSKEGVLVVRQLKMNDLQLNFI